MLRYVFSPTRWSQAKTNTRSGPSDHCSACTPHLPIPSQPPMVTMSCGPCKVKGCPCEAGSFETSGGPVADLLCVCEHLFHRHHASDDAAERLPRHDTTPRFVSKPSWCPRTVVVTRLFERVLEHRIVLVRGTPACGKTVLLNLLHQRISEQKPEWKVHVFHYWPAGMNHIESAEFIEAGTGVSINELMSGQGRVVFIDDAQDTYYDSYLWGLLKFVDGNSGAYFVLFSAYGSPGRFPVQMRTGTPPVLRTEQRVSLTWDKTDGADPLGLLLTPNEADDVIERGCKYNQDQFVILKDLKELLFQISGGHVGALASLIHTIFNDHVVRRGGGGQFIDVPRFRDAFFESPTASRLCQKLSMERFGRGLPWQEDVEEKMVAHVLKKLARESKLSQSQFNAEFQGKSFKEYEAALLRCYHKGWIHKVLLHPGTGSTEEAYIFPSPLHHWHCRALLLSQAPVKSPLHKSPLDMAITIIKEFKPSKLSDPPRGPNNIASAPLDDHYAKEWYRSSDLVLEGNFLWSPEFGTLSTKRSGAIDFYLADYKWGFEFTREGRDLLAHSNLFLTGGGYHRWMVSGELVDYLLLDFRTNIPSARHPGSLLSPPRYGSSIPTKVLSLGQTRKTCSIFLSPTNLTT